MRLLLAPQEFKGTLTAVEAAAAMAEALRQAFPALELDLLPMADGGPGTLDALLAAAGGERRLSEAHDPLLQPIEAEWGVLPDGTAVIECAAASGLLRVQPAQRDALRATSRGTGDLIAAALDAGHERFLIGLGGSATTDGGAGMAQALGFRLLDTAGLEVGPGGAALIGLARIDVSDVDPRLARAVFRAATDVTNPLCGPDGAAAVYGPQKGADPEAVTILDRALEQLAAVIARDLGVDIRDVAGAGAAGGLGAGVIAFLGGELLPGAALVGAAARIEERIAAADGVLTGEGRLDRQTAFGKAPGYVAALARRLGRPVACVAGSRGDGFEEAAAGFDIVEVASHAGLTSRGRPQDEVGAAAVEAVRRLIGAGLLR